MATAAAPLFHSTKGTTNYASLCRLLVDVGAHILRETFDKRRPTGNLDAVLSSPPVHAVLRSLRHKRILNPSQWGKLYPAIKSAVSSNSFDISLLMVLLRKICGLAPPATGWDTPPPEADTTLEADIVRIKCYIYTVYSHASEASVDDPTFSQYWQDIQDALVRLGGAGYQSAIDDLKKEYMDPDLEEPYKQLLKQCVMCEVSIKERLYEIGKSEVELKKAAVNPEKKAGDKAIEVPKGKTDRDRKQDSSPANEEGEVPYYTGRKDLADIEDATVDTDDSEKTLIKSDKIGGKEDTWYLREAGASIKLCSGAVQQPAPFTCRCLLWNPRTRSPPIASDEILVSSVIEISHDGPPDLDYKKSFEGISFTLSLLHSAPYLEGYEVVIKQLTDQENNKWKELKTENTWHGSETSTVPKWLFPFAQAVCTKSAVSSFAAVWRPKSFTFSRGTAGGPELTCIVPDLPDVSVQIPQSCVPVYQDFCVTIKVQEFPSSELKGEGGLVGPVLYISGSQNVALIAPVTIRIPLTFRKGKQELAELRPGELRILQCESLIEAHDWKDITDQLDEPPRLVDGKVQFKVRHFSGFRPIKLMRSLLQSTSGFTEFVGKLCDRSRPQHARFFTCLCETGVRGHFKLKLFCYPQRLYFDVIRKISECVVPYKVEGYSSKPVCGEEKILVSLSEAIKPQGTDQKNALQFVRFHENKVYYTGGEVCLGSENVPGVKFCNRNQELLCNIIMVLAFQVSIPVTSDFEEGSGISSQSVKHSIVKRPNSRSSSCSPVASPRKRRRQSADIYVVKDDEPSDEELEYLSRELAEKWKTLGRRLGFNEAAIDDFDQANKKLKEKAYKMLMAWKQKVGSEATYKVLYDTLCHELVECKHLAEQHCCDKIVGNASP